MERATKFMKDEKKDVKSILKIFKNRSFNEGYTGIAVKNSAWNLLRTSSSKFGALFLSILLARFLAPELFGRYSLVISTLVLFGVFADFGINQALQIYLSKKSDTERRKAKGYYSILLKYKILLSLFTSLVLLFLANWIANSYYHKNIYSALIIGAIYIPIVGLVGFFESVVISQNNFKVPFIRETILQVVRFLLILIFLIFFIESNPTKILNGIILLLIFSYSASLLYLLSRVEKVSFISSKSPPLSADDKKDLWRFILPVGLISLTGLFNHIDILMLGYYTKESFIGYYSISASLIAALSLIIAGGIGSLLPIFSRLNGKRLVRAFRKSRKLVFLLSLLGITATLLASNLIISILYGQEYLVGINYFRILSLLLITAPLILLYELYYLSQKLTKLVFVLSTTSIVLNIILNFVFINIGLAYGGMYYAVIGACVATVISRGTYLALMVFWRRLNFLRDRLAPTLK